LKAAESGSGNHARPAIELPAGKLIFSEGLAANRFF